MSRKRSEARGEGLVFFPWEKRRGLRSLFARGRVRQALLVVCALGGFLVLSARERHAADVRATRAEITMAGSALGAWRADHDRACPGSLADLVSGGYLHEIPRDAWGRPLRVICPGRREPLGFDVSSDGPDGEPGGLDRVE
jgi:general secretion pathway protein G